MHYNPFTTDNGDACRVIAGTHKGKRGTIQDRHERKTGQITMRVVQEYDLRFKTLLRNVTAVTDPEELNQNLA